MKVARVICGILFAFVITVFANAAEVTEIPFKEGAKPPTPEEGYVWCLVTKPAVMETVKDRVKVKEATFYMQNVPAKYKWKEETIVLVPAYKKPVVSEVEMSASRDFEVRETFEYKFIPAKYKTVQEEVVVVPAYEKLVVKEPVFKETEEKYIVAPARSEVDSFDCPASSVVKDGETKGECYIKLNAKAKEAKYTKKVLVTPGSIEKIKIQAVTKTITVKKLIEEARIKKIPVQSRVLLNKSIVTPQKVEYVDVPAVTKTIKKMVKIAPANTRRIDVPAKYKVVEKQIVVTPAVDVWRKIPVTDCNKEAVRKVVKRYGAVPGSSSY